VGTNVLYLGLTSLFTDISSEMISTVLPLYLVLYLQLSPLTFGVVDGLYQGASALVRVASGVVADRWRQHKHVAAFGYGLSAVCKLGLLGAGSAWGAIAGVVLLDRTGKGIRTSPRDALISLSAPQENLGVAFGVHRSLDTAGAMLGPLVAFGLLSMVPNAFDAVFVASFCAALVGLGIIVIFVENRAPDPAAGGTAFSFRAAVGLLGGRRFRTIVLAGTVLSLVTMSDNFIYLTLQRRQQFAGTLIPLLYTATALIYFVLAVPAGRLADRVGQGRVLLGGYAALLAVYGVLVLPAGGIAALLGSVSLLGAYYAATDGVVAALASGALPAGLRGSGIGLLSTSMSLARLLASVLFGVLWTWWGVETAVATFAVGLAAMTALAAAALSRNEVAVLD
jgi:MFS family permease